MQFSGVLDLLKGYEILRPPSIPTRRSRSGGVGFGFVDCAFRGESIGNHFLWKVSTMHVAVVERVRESIKAHLDG